MTRPQLISALWLLPPGPPPPEPLSKKNFTAPLFPKPSSEPLPPGLKLPPEMCQLIVNLKAEYPGFSLREISTICYLRFGRKLSHHTVQRVLVDGPKPTVTSRRYPSYAQIADP